MSTFISVWPAPGLIVAKAPGLYYSAGESVALTSRVQHLIDAGDLLTSDPGVPPAAIPQIEGGYTSRGILATDLANTRGAFAGQVAFACGRSANFDGGEGMFAWDPDSTATVNGGTVLGFIATGRWLRIYAGEIDCRWFGIVSGTAADQSSKVAQIWAAASVKGDVMHFPRGTYRLDQKSTFLPVTFYGNFGVGPRIRGDGELATVFDARVSNDAVFAFDSTTDHTTFKGMLGVELKGFTIKRTVPKVSAPNATAIRLRGCYHVDLEHVHVDGMTQYGIEIQTITGDNDACNMVKMMLVRVENCDGWGIKSDAATGHNENSFTQMTQVFVQGCGAPDSIWLANCTSPGYLPSSGGFIWKGQSIVMQNCGFTINNNCAMCIPGDDGLALSVKIDIATFENTIGGYHFVCTGVGSLYANAISLHGNDTYVCSGGFKFDGSSKVIKNVRLVGTIVRASTANSPYTAFDFSGTNLDTDSCFIEDTDWQNFFNTPAQACHSAGVKFPTYSRGCRLELQSDTVLVLKANHYAPNGNIMPIRQARGAGANRSTTGEWRKAIFHYANGKSISNAGLAANQRYYCYLIDNNGSTELRLATTAPAIDALSGHLVKSGDATWAYVGSVKTDGSSKFMLTASGWLNPLLVPGRLVGTFDYVWSDDNHVLRISSTSPTSDSDGVSVGSQT